MGLLGERGVSGDIIERGERIERDYIKLGDCLLLMREIPDHSIDMVLCDLPYGITVNSWDKPLPLDKLWGEYKRIVKEHTAILLFGQGKFFSDLVESNRQWFRYDLVWDKMLPTGFLNARRMPMRRHEQIAVFYKKLPCYNPQFSRGQPLHSRGQAYLNKVCKNQNYGKFLQQEDVRVGSTEKFPTSIIQIEKTLKSKVHHSTEKPVELLEYLIRTYSNEGDTVLDNCMGSGSTAVACINTKRHFIGYEKDAVIYKGAQERLAKIMEK